MSKNFSYRVEDLYEHERIDKFLVSYLKDYTRGVIQQAIKAGEVLVNDQVIKANYKLRLGDRVTITMADSDDIPILPEDIPLHIIYEDADLMVVNKEPGMVVHPAPGNYSGTLVNALLYYTKGNLSNINSEIRPGIVHRIDKDTSGIMMVAKTNESHEKLAQMLHDYEVTRKYHVIVSGNFKEDQGFIDAAIGRNPVQRKKMIVDGENPRAALTFYKVIEQFKGYAYLEVKLHTGRKHQIRVHMKHIGHPVVGDPVYGHKKQPYSTVGLLLHAKALGFDHPITKEHMEFDCPLPSYFQKVIDTLPKI